MNEPAIAPPSPHRAPVPSEVMSPFFRVLLRRLDLYAPAAVPSAAAPNPILLAIEPTGACGACCIA